MTATPSPPASTVTGTPAAVTWTQALEHASVLDPVIAVVRPAANWFVAEPGRRDLLRGAWLGHAVHPPLTDVPIGLFTSALTLDLIGGKAARPAARRLIALGVLTAVPTFWTGWAEWTALEKRDQRVGLVHAVSNGTAVFGFVASWRARGRGQQAKGVALALAASGLMAVGGYLGGHLVSARKVSSHHPSFD
jgi:uncharacterized membrane protein